MSNELKLRAHRNRFPVGHHIHRTDIAAGAPSPAEEVVND